MTRRVSFHESAIEDARTARLWYSGNNPRLADEFMEEMERALAFIAKTPESWPSFEAGTRRFLLCRFPYSIIYRLRENEIEVLAVAHAKRRPRYWRDRER